MWQRLLEAMRTLNYVEGQNLVVKLGIAEGRPARLPGLVAELIQANVDVPFPEIQRELETAARKVGITLSYVGGIKTPGDFDLVLARAKKDGVGGIIAPLGALTYAHRRVLAQARPQA